MSTQTLTRVTLDTLENYGRAATQAVTAYRLGSQRLAAAVDGAITQRVTPSFARIAPQAEARMGEARDQMFEIVRKGIDAIAARSESAIELGRKAAVAQVGRFSDLAKRVDTPALSNGLQAVARISLPGAKVALAVSGKVAEGAVKLADAVGGETPAKAVRRAAGSAKRVARKAATPVRRASRKTVKTVTAKVRAAKRSAA
jgi:hypothetical protein